MALTIRSMHAKLSETRHSILSILSREKVAPEPRAVIDEILETAEALEQLLHKQILKDSNSVCRSGDNSKVKRQSKRQRRKHRR